MIECAQCGRCCNDINSPTAPEDVKKIPAQEGRLALVECWEYIGRIADGRYHYKCRYFNGKTCEAHDRRPEVCRGYPFYGKPEVGKKYALDKDCIYYQYFKMKGAFNKGDK
jgi:Fe-S-cluster containining protein